MSRFIKEITSSSYLAVEEDMREQGNPNHIYRSIRNARPHEFEILQINMQMIVGGNNGHRVSDAKADVQNNIQHIRAMSIEDCGDTNNYDEEIDVDARVIRRIFVQAQGIEEYSTISWVLSEDCEECMLCSNFFTWTVWKHHCRSCGIVICGYCSSHQAEVKQIKFEGRVRVCNSCSNYVQNDFIDIKDVVKPQGASITAIYGSSKLVTKRLKQLKSEDDFSPTVKSKLPGKNVQTRNQSPPNQTPSTANILFKSVDDPAPSPDELKQKEKDGDGNVVRSMMYEFPDILSPDKPHGHEHGNGHGHGFGHTDDDDRHSHSSGESEVDANTTAKFGGVNKDGTRRKSKRASLMDNFRHIPQKLMHLGETEHIPLIDSMFGLTPDRFVSVTEGNEVILQSANDPSLLVGWQVRLLEGEQTVRAYQCYVIVNSRKTAKRKTEFHLMRDIDDMSAMWVRLRRGKHRGQKFWPLTKVYLGEVRENER